MKFCSYAKLVLFLWTPLFSTQAFEFVMDDGSKINAYWDPPAEGPFSLCVVIPGSQKESTLRIHDALKNEISHAGMCPLTLEKRGIHGDQIEENEFLDFLNLDQRIEDHLKVLKTIGHDNLLPSWNGRISILGQGDGGRIAARVARQISGVQAIVLIASGGGWPPLEEALYSFRSEMVQDGYSPQYIHGFLVQAREEFDRARQIPKTDRKAFGYTYKYWASFLKNNLMDDLAHLDCPIYSINGSKDDRIPIESVNVLEKKLKNKVTLIRVEKAGREIIQAHETYQEAISWLKKKNS